ncbi:MAG: starch-binding protein [Prolixibacteraceae bacterium]
MRNINYLFGLFFIAAILFACEDTYERVPEGDTVSTNPVLNALFENEFILEAPEGGDDGQFLFRLSWSRPRISYENGLPVNVENLTYTLEAGILSQNFETKLAVDSTEELFLDIYAAKLYQIVESLAGGDFEEAQNVELRITATYDGSPDTLISNTIPVVVSKIATWEPTEVTIRFRQTVGDWSAFAVYAWGESEVYGGWPGQVLTPNAEGWYSFTVPVNRPVNLIMNNNGGGKQFDFMSDPTESACYEFDTSNSTFTAVDCPSLPLTIRWKYTGTTWTSFGIYAWGGSPATETFGGWPGQVVTPDAQGWCSVSVPAGQAVGNVIFNNGTGGDGGQFDVAMAISEDVCFEITSNSFTVVDCN